MTENAKVAAARRLGVQIFQCHGPGCFTHFVGFRWTLLVTDGPFPSSTIRGQHELCSRHCVENLRRQMAPYRAHTQLRDPEGHWVE